jgi:putative peptidoglycan lipid II flippase
LNLLRALSTVSGMTLLSRITGLARESLKAAAFGAGMQMDAFEAAFRLPNILRRLFAEGAFSQAFVPIFAEYRRHRGDDETRALVSRVGTLLAMSLLLLTLIGVLAAPWLVYALATGFDKTPGKVELTAQMIRIVFPYLFFVSLVSLAGGVLNVYRRFAIPAVTPVLLNVSIIGARCSSRPTAIRRSPRSRGVCSSAARTARAADPSAAEDRNARRPRLDWRDPGVRRVLIAMGPAVIGVSAAQISALINTQLAASLGDGRISWITYADRLMEFPSALLGVALGTVLLPSLAKLHAEARHDEYTSLLDWGLRLAFLLALPAAVALWILRSRSSPPFTSTGASRSRTCCRRAPRSSATAWACSAHRGQDPGAGLLCAAGDVHAGQDRVLDGARHADAGADPHAADRPRRIDARDVDRRLLQREPALLVPEKRGIYTPAPGWLPFLSKLCIALFVLARRFCGSAARVVLDRGVPVAEGRSPLRVCGAGWAVLFRGALAAGVQLRDFNRRDVTADTPLRRGGDAARLR